MSLLGVLKEVLYHYAVIYGFIAWLGVAYGLKMIFTGKGKPVGRGTWVVLLLGLVMVPCLTYLAVKDLGFF